jgi:hypothetical protein
MLPTVASRLPYYHRTVPLVRGYLEENDEHEDTVCRLPSINNNETHFLLFRV